MSRCATRTDYSHWLLTFICGYCPIIQILTLTQYVHVKATYRLYTKMILLIRLSLFLTTSLLANEASLLHYGIFSKIFQNPIGNYLIWLHLLHHFQIDLIIECSNLFTNRFLRNLTLNSLAGKYELNVLLYNTSYPVCQGHSK